MQIERPLLLAVLVPLLAALAPADVPTPGWQQWRHVPGVFDLSGPRTDGRLVMATSGRLLLLDRAGAVTPFATGPGGYADDAGTEAYLAVSPGLRVADANCDFTPDDVFVLRLHPPFGVTRVTTAGAAAPFATVPDVESLNGIAFDTTGRFGHRLLVSGPARGRTTIAAIDCRGDTRVVTSAAPVLEGGLAVAPPGFGSFAGALIAPDELSGRIYAIGADGSVGTVAESGLPAGGDTGVESLGFVPAGFARGGSVYYADRGTPGNPHPGTDNVLRLDAGVLRAAGVRDGDLLAATEGGAALIAVRCTASSCTVSQVVATPTTAHGEGHLAVVVAGPAAGAASRRAQVPAGVVALVVLLLAAAAASVVWALRRRRKTASPPVVSSSGSHIDSA